MPAFTSPEPSHTCDLPHEGSSLRPLSTPNFQTVPTAGFPIMIVPKSRTLASGGGGWPAEVSTDPAPVQLFSKHPAKISIKLPEVLRCPHRRHNRDREGSQLVEVTALCKEPLRSQRKAVFSEHNQEAFGFYCLLYQGGTQALIKISSIFKTGPFFPGSQENCSRPSECRDHRLQHYRLGAGHAQLIPHGAIRH